VSDLDSDIDDTLSEASWNSEDDPERLWCICRKPHNNRFMICCDVCEEWFHGKCVGISKQIGKAIYYYNRGCQRRTLGPFHELNPVRIRKRTGLN